MSLLLDARRKIELALEQGNISKTVTPQLPETQNYQNQSARSAPAGMPGSRPLEGASFTGMRGDPVAAPARSTPTGTPLLRSDPVAAGKNLFAAKSAPPRGSRRMGIISIALISSAVIAAAGGYYIWRETTPPVQAVRLAPKQIPASPIALAAPPSKPIAEPPRQEAATVAPVAQPAVQLSVTKEPARPQQATPALPEQKARKAANKLPAAQPKQQADRRLPKEDMEETRASSAPAAQSVSIERGQRQAGVDPALLAAWQAYRSGDFDRAGQHYDEMLKRDAKNRDALLGMAAIAQQQARDDAAAHYYRQVLALDPRDPAAQAALLSLSGTSPETDVESRLKLLLAQQPQSAALHFAIGNLYAGQLRWSEAQQSFFAASNLEPDNTQFAFNLAVSLDHLGKGKIAVQHYQRALQLGNAATSGINREQVRIRMDELMAAH